MRAFHFWLTSYLNSDFHQLDASQVLSCCAGRVVRVFQLWLTVSSSLGSDFPQAKGSSKRLVKRLLYNSTLFVGKGQKVCGFWLST